MGEYSEAFISFVLNTKFLWQVQMWCTAACRCSSVSAASSSSGPRGVITAGTGYCTRPQRKRSWRADQISAFKHRISDVKRCEEQETYMKQIEAMFTEVNPVTHVYHCIPMFTEVLAPMATFGVCSCGAPTPGMHLENCNPVRFSLLLKRWLVMTTIYASRCVTMHSYLSISVILYIYI